MTEASQTKKYVKGSLSLVPFPKVLHFINLGQKTGILAITRSKKKVHVHFSKGQIVFVTSSYFPGYTLGDFLINEGKISLPIQEESIAAIIESGNKQGIYLIEKGYLSPHELFESLNRQVFQKLYWIFQWQEGDFFFKEGEIATKDLQVLDIKMQGLIYQGIRDHMRLDSLPTEFKGRKESNMMRKPNLEFGLNSLGLGPSDTRVLSFVNGRHTLRQIVTLSKMKKRTVYKILYGLFLTGVVCFPEGIAHESKTRRINVAPPISKEEKEKTAYNIRISDDLISQAMKSVDKAKEKAQTQRMAVNKEEIDLEILQEPGLTQMPAEPAPSQTPEEESFSFAEEQSPEVVEQDIALADDSTYNFDFDQSSDPEDELSDDDFADQIEEDDSSTLSDVNLDDYTNPDEMFEQGMVLLEENRWNEAEAFLTKAGEMLPDKSEIQAYKGWSIYNNSEKYLDNNFQAAEQTIKESMKSQKITYLHFLYLGKIYAEEREHEFAELHFVKALEMNVDCTEAREQIKRLHSK